ncbi:uncharacterized protein L3040_001207 [Drepanopeziza brunnea f. sp. 'multigermtubi']|uniref:uncharacterized protein n=1 Tax=Drepanopeziza brunnea f. sp. 'multigermtubi' TaxID=698441 RepID=UPI0023A4B41C|nr:hypothetical protein L3040_001207 [Drepanopeziza brunnea f. sp. 'multigermtubi']
MVSKSLELDRFSLINTTESWKLEVVSAADFQIPGHLANLDLNVVLEALSSRKVWASRAMGCKIDMEILLDGKQLLRNVSDQWLQSLGVRIRDAKAWQKLFISTSLEIPEAGPHGQQSHAWVHLKNSAQQANRAEGEGLAAWLGSSTDLKVPAGVVSFKFESLRMQFDFMRVQVKPKSKRTRTLEGNTTSFDVMLLDVPAETQAPHDTHSKNLEKASKALKHIPDKIAGFFRTPQPSGLGNQSPLFTLHLQAHNADAITGASRKTFAWGENIQKGRKGRHPEKVVEVVREWLISHHSNQYPTAEEKQQLMDLTGLQRVQLSTLLRYQRQKLRKWAPIIDETHSKDEMLLDYEDSPGIYHAEEHGNDKMLFSQTSTSSSISPGSSSSRASLSPFSKHRFTPDPSDMSIPASILSNLVDAATGVLFGGNVGPCLLKARDTELSKPPPRSSLSQLVPVMFSPGYNESVAHNARYLPTISRALSTSLPHNIQTPSLKRKLLQLSSCDPSYFYGRSNDCGEPGALERLSFVTQTRLWAMIQRKIYDTTAATKLWRQTLSDESLHKDSDFEDLFGSIGGQDRVVSDLGDSFTDDGMLFTDDEDDESLLLDKEVGEDSDWERRAIEFETDEMLLSADQQEADEDGNGMYLINEIGLWVRKNKEDDTDMLLGDGGDGDDMLL